MTIPDPDCKVLGNFVTNLAKVDKVLSSVNVANMKKYTLRAEMFAELIFAILVINCEKRSSETCKILNNGVNLFRKI